MAHGGYGWLPFDCYFTPRFTWQVCPETMLHVRRCGGWLENWGGFVTKRHEWGKLNEAHCQAGRPHCRASVLKHCWLCAAGTGCNVCALIPALYVHKYVVLGFSTSRSSRGDRCCK
jgi:hypothetical protein